ncbi:hypothetical protein ACG02S_00720 [Roseateles sp. DC23W]|uniref:Transposase, Mutator family n=1 Tax=Pelomonas dachongensis TaxID=3299029 RepID=A0ABW7EGW5_9BURK
MDAKPEVLRDALRTDNMPDDFMAHIGTLLDEAPMSMLAKVVEQIHADDGIHHGAGVVQHAQPGQVVEARTGYRPASVLKDQQAMRRQDRHAPAGSAWVKRGCRPWAVSNEVAGCMRWLAWKAERRAGKH